MLWYQMISANNAGFCKARGSSGILANVHKKKKNNNNNNLTNWLQPRVGKKMNDS